MRFQKIRKTRFWVFFFLSWTGVLPCLFLAGCQKATYPAERVINSIQEICREEYHIENVDVKFSGTTIGVFLPLKRLFAADVRKVVLSGEAANLESLFNPLPEAMEQVENVLFAISRVLLSSDREIDFYEFYATDVASTGLELVLTGYVPDIRRVRLWDISRDEYRRRVFHDLRLNRAALWQKPAHDFFQNVGVVKTEELIKRSFGNVPTSESVSPLFYDFLLGIEKKRNLKIQLKEIKSRPYQGNQALVYVRFVETYESDPQAASATHAYPSETELEYIFVLDLLDDGYKIIQVIPFYYLDEQKQLKKVSFPPELDLYKNLESWSDQFEVKEINLGEFLSGQLDRRAKELLFADERVRNTIRHAQMNFVYRRAPEELTASHPRPYFAFHFDFQSKQMRKLPSLLEQVVGDEDVLYVLNLILHEFVNLIRSYRFTDYSHFELVWDAAQPAATLAIEPAQLELFRKGKLDVSALLGKPIQPFSPS